MAKSQAKIRIDFDEATHTYRAFDKPQPSVTTILGLIGEYKFINKDILDRAARFGTAVHRATHLMDENRLDVGTLAVALVPYLEGWKKFLSETGFQILDCECKVASKKGYAGTLDRVGYLDNSLTVLDIKSGSTVPKTTSLQLAAYGKAFEEMTGKRVKKRLCVKLKPLDYSITEYTDDRDFLIFLNFLNVYKWNRNG